MKNIALLLSLPLSLAACKTTEPTQSTAAAPAGSVELCNGQVIDISQQGNPAALDRFVGTWKGSTEAITGRWKGCSDKEVTLVITKLPNGQLRSVRTHGGHSCGESSFTRTTEFGLDRFRGDMIYGTRDGRHSATMVQGNQLIQTNNTARSRSCWVQTLTRMDG